MTHLSSSRKISVNQPVCEILDKFPETKKVFRHYGLEQYLKSLENETTLQKLLTREKIDPDGFLRLLEEHSLNTPSSPRTLAERAYHQRDLNFLALLPCPLKIPFENAYSEFNSREWNDDPPYTGLLESNANNQLSYYQHVRKFTDISQMPDVVISPGFNGYYFKDFFNQFRGKNLLYDPMQREASPYPALDLQDPSSEFSILGANIEVLLINHSNLGDLEVPESWSDLLKPEYENSLTIRGQEGFFCETVLLSIYKEYGIDGVRQFARTVKTGSHPSEMVKSARSRHPISPPISVMPLFFAKIAENSPDVSIVWPDEGAIISPVTMVVKKDHPEELDPLISFLAGEKTGELFNKAWFMSTTGVTPCVSPEQEFNWLGWDYICSHDLGAEIDLVSDEFIRIFKGKN